MTKYQFESYSQNDPHSTTMRQRPLSSKGLQEVQTWRFSDDVLVHGRSIETWTDCGLQRMMYAKLMLDRRLVMDPNLDTDSKGTPPEVPQPALQKHHILDATYLESVTIEDFRANLVTSACAIPSTESLSLPLLDWDFPVRYTRSSGKGDAWFDTRLHRSFSLKEQRDILDILIELECIRNRSNWINQQTLQMWPGHTTVIVPSTKFYHIYINTKILTRDYSYLLQSLEEYGIVQSFWVEKTIELGYARLRLPHVTKNKSKQDGPFDVSPIMTSSPFPGGQSHSGQSNFFQGAGSGSTYNSGGVFHGAS